MNTYLLIGYNLYSVVAKDNQAIDLEQIEQSLLWIGRDLWKIEEDGIINNGNGEMFQLTKGDFIYKTGWEEHKGLPTVGIFYKDSKEAETLENILLDYQKKSMEHAKSTTCCGNCSNCVKAVGECQVEDDRIIERIESVTNEVL